MTTETSAVLPDSFAPIKTLPLEPGEYEDLVWLDNERLVTRYDDETIDNFSSHQLGMFSLSSTHIIPLNLPSHDRCQGMLYSTLMPVITHDHRLAYLSRCVLSPSEGFRDYLMVYDPTSGATRSLRANMFDPITSANHVGRVHAYSFFPDLKTGVLVDSWTGATQLHTFDETSVTRVDLRVDVVGSAALSPDGTKLLITTQQGKKGIDMLDEPYRIELVDPTTWERRPLFNGYNVAILAWSHDDQYIVIGSSADAYAPTDVWLVKVSTGERRRIGTDSFGHLSWSPDGTTLAATRFVSSAPLNSLRELVLLDLTEVELP